MTIDKYINNTYCNNDGYRFTVTELSHRTKKDKYYKLMFDSGYEATATPTDFTRGRVKDYLSPSYSKVGILGYADLSKNKRAVRVWRNMLNRCYNPNFGEYKRYGNIGVSVCDRWKRLDFFLDDLPKVDGYDEELFNSGKIQLDKDTKYDGNKTYSLETCAFVSPQKNSASARGKKVEATNSTGEILKFNSILACARHFEVHRGIIERRLDKNVENNGWFFTTIL